MNNEYVSCKRTAIMYEFNHYIIETFDWHMAYVLGSCVFVHIAKKSIKMTVNE